MSDNVASSPSREINEAVLGNSVIKKADNRLSIYLYSQYGLYTVWNVHDLVRTATFQLGCGEVRLPRQHCSQRRGGVYNNGTADCRGERPANAAARNI